MSIFVESPHLEPLMRIMGLPPSLVRYLPQTAQKRLHTTLLRDAPFAKSLAMDWADDCFLTTLEGEAEKVTHVSLSVPGARRTLSGVHLALFGHKGQLNLVLGSEGNGIDGAHILTPMPYLISAGKVTQNNVPTPMYILARLNLDSQCISVSNEYADLKLGVDTAPF